MILAYDKFILEKKGPCWAGYKQIGTKDKDGRPVPNCVKENSDVNEEKETLQEFSENRLAGATKISKAAKEKGGDALLTYTHFNVKPSYYKKAINGKFDKEAAKKEFEETYKKISLDMTQTEFQREVGRLEVIGELLIREK